MLDMGFDNPKSDLKDPTDSEFSEGTSQASEPLPLDPSDKVVIARAAERAKWSFLAFASVTSVYDRGPLARKSEGLLILPDFVAERHSSWKAPRTRALPRTQLTSPQPP